MFTQTEVTPTGDIIVNTVKSPVLTFTSDYILWGTEVGKSGVTLRKQFTKIPMYQILSKTVNHLDDLILTIDKEPYQGAITLIETTTSGAVKLFGLTDYGKSDKTLICDIGYGKTLINSPVYDRYLLDCTSIPEDKATVSLYSDLSVGYTAVGYVLTEKYSSVNIESVHRIGSIFALTFEPVGTKIRFAVSFDNHNSYFVFNKKQLVPMSSDSDIILGLGNDSSDLCYGFRNMIPTAEQKNMKFKVVLQSDHPSITPVFYGFRCSLYSTIKNKDID